MQYAICLLSVGHTVCCVLAPPKMTELDKAVPKTLLVWERKEKEKKILSRSIMGGREVINRERGMGSPTEVAWPSTIR